METKTIIIILIAGIVGFTLFAKKKTTTDETSDSSENGGSTRVGDRTATRSTNTTAGTPRTLQDYVPVNSRDRLIAMA